MKKILVLGATGPQARPVAEQLVSKGASVTAMVRDPAKAEALAERGVRLVKGDFDDAASLKAAMEGQDGVFMLIPFFTGTADQARTIIDAAAAAGVKRIVWNVAGRILPFDVGNPAIDKWRPILAALEASGVPFTAIQPTVYMENFLIPAIAQEVAEKNVLAYPMPESVRCQWISHQDAAAFSVEAFYTDNADNLLLEVSGPEKLSGSEIAQRFGKALGREIVFRPMPPAEFAGTFPDGADPAPIITHYQNVFDNPDLMSTNVDYELAINTLPITATSVEDFARLYGSAFTNAA